MTEQTETRHRFVGRIGCDSCMVCDQFKEYEAHDGQGLPLDVWKDILKAEITPREPAEEPGELVKRISGLRSRCQSASDGDNADYMADTLLECDRFLASLLEQRDTKSSKEGSSK